MKKVIKIIREQINEVFGGEAKIQANFNWQDGYSDKLKNSLEIVGNNVVLYHYGNDGETNFLDPANFGYNSYTESDVKQWSKKRVFFYIHPEDKELRVNGKEYIVKYPLDKLYPFVDDPYNFYNECKLEIFDQNMIDAYGDNLSIPIGRQVPCIGQKIVNAGFDGMIVSWGNTYRVDIWEKVSI